MCQFIERGDMQLRSRFLTMATIQSEETMARISVLFMCISSLTQTADAKPVSLKFGTGLGIVLAFPDGEIEPLPVQLRVGLGVAVPVDDTWSWYTEVGFSTAMTSFEPSPRIFTGPNYTVNEAWGVGLSMLYQHNPSNESHLLGLSVTAGMKVAERVSLILLLGTGRSFDKIGDGAWSFVFQPKLSFTLF